MMSDNPLAALNRSRIALLTTYKRDGTAVSTPVSIVVERDGAVAYIRTYSHAGKAKRLRRNPPCWPRPRHFAASPSTRQSVVWRNSWKGTPPPGHRAGSPDTRPPLRAW